jgi:hypothetical protein
MEAGSKPLQRNELLYVVLNGKQGIQGSRCNATPQGTIMRQSQGFYSRWAHGRKKGSLTPFQCTAHSAAFIIVHNQRPFLSPHAHITKSQQQVCMQIRGKNKQFREVKGTMKVHSSSSFLSKRYKIEFGEPLSADPMCTSPPTEAYMIRKQKKKKNSTSLECTALPPL